MVARGPRYGSRLPLHSLLPSSVLLAFSMALRRQGGLPDDVAAHRCILVLLYATLVSLLQLLLLYATLVLLFPRLRLPSPLGAALRRRCSDGGGQRAYRRPLLFLTPSMCVSNVHTAARCCNIRVCV